MWRSTAKYITAAGIGGGSSYYYLQNINQEKASKEDHQNKIKSIVRDQTEINLNSYTHLKGIKKWDWNWDHREPTVPTKDGQNCSDSEFIDVKAPGKNAVRNILLIRHGQYDTDGKLDKDRKLTNLGHQQARYTGDRVAHYYLLAKQRAAERWKLKNPDVDINDENDGFTFPKLQLFQSSMMRAQQTSSDIKEVLKEAKIDFEYVGESDLLREGPPYPTEPPLSKWAPEAKYWEESARIEAGFRKFIHRAEEDQTDESYEVITCHGNVIRYFICRALQLPPEAWLRISLAHGSITNLSVSPKGTVSLRSMGDNGYMPVDKCSRR